MVFVWVCVVGRGIRTVLDFDLLRFAVIEEVERAESNLAKKKATQSGAQTIADPAAMLILLIPLHVVGRVYTVLKHCPPASTNSPLNMAEQTDAAKRAAARKAKILARGNAGLNKLAQTARGDEAAALYGDGAYLLRLRCASGLGAKLQTLRPGLPLRLNHQLRLPQTPRRSHPGLHHQQTQQAERTISNAKCKNSSHRCSAAWAVWAVWVEWAVRAEEWAERGCPISKR